MPAVYGIPSKLPDSRDVDIGVLSGLFGEATNSYKFLFFLSLLDLVTAPDGVFKIPVRRLIARWIERAWYPLQYFRLSFGKQDGTERVVDDIASKLHHKVRFTPEGEAELCASIDSLLRDKDIKRLRRYVVARVLRPFFRSETRGLLDAKVDSAISRLADAEFESRRPLYRERQGEIEIHPAWVSYIREHASILEGWALWHWLEFLQARNTDIPNLVAKVNAPRERARLTAATDYWKALFSEDSRVRCIYSGRPLSAATMSLDHFVPWSFVAHDRLWNLIPADPRANSSKGDTLPDWARYRKAFIELQTRGLLANRANGKKGWLDVAEPFIVDMRVADKVLRRGSPTAVRGALAEAYETTIPPLIAIARRRGFR